MWKLNLQLIFSIISPILLILITVLNFSYESNIVGYLVFFFIVSYIASFILTIQLWSATNIDEYWMFLYTVPVLGMAFSIYMQVEIRKLILGDHDLVL